MRSCTRGLRERLSAILAELPPPGSSQAVAATPAAWAVWQAGLTTPFTLPEDLPPLRLLLVWDNLTGPKTPDLVLGLCAHGVMPLSTPVGGSWLNMAESIERVLKRRALDGQHPHSPKEIGSWFEQTAQRWNEQPTPFANRFVKTVQLERQNARSHGNRPTSFRLTT